MCVCAPARLLTDLVALWVGSAFPEARDKRVDPGSAALYGNENTPLRALRDAYREVPPASQKARASIIFRKYKL